MKPLSPTVYGLLTALLGGPVFRTAPERIDSTGLLLLAGKTLVRYQPAAPGMPYSFLFCVV
ncbi:MAG: hypothetical protein LH609_03130 [Rudanella sp.]|nr:hypothetical protein [Rudanella sp.]